MFIVRERHMEALSRARLDDFVRRTARDLRRRYDSLEGAPEQGLQEWIHASIPDAESYGLSAEPMVVSFLEYRLVYGHEFPLGDDHAWARSILEDVALDPPDKLLRLDELHARFCLIQDDADAGV